MRQSAFTIVTEIEGDEAKAALESLLTDIGNNVTHDKRLPFPDFEDLHFASLSVTDAKDGKSYLVFEGNIDGNRDTFLRQLERLAGATLDDIYAGSAGYPKGDRRTPDSVLRYLRKHDLGANAFFVAWPGQTVGTLMRQQELRDRIEAMLSEPGAQACQTPQALHQWIGGRVRSDPDLAWAATPPTTPFLVRHGLAVVLLPAAPLTVAIGKQLLSRSPRRRRSARAGLLALVGGAGGVALQLRAHERADDRRDSARDPDWLTAFQQWSVNLGGIQYREDVQVQNHMTSVTDIKEGRFRYILLRGVLTAINLVARLFANKGVLAGIRSIHFARWVVAPDRTRLIFLSNYDGSWESYLGDFVDRAAKGLSAVWSNTDNQVGFPRTRWLVNDGARQEVRLKAFARVSMVPTRTWYSAYPTLSVDNIRSNTAIHQGLFASLDRDAALAWLRLL